MKTNPLPLLHILALLFLPSLLQAQQPRMGEVVCSLFDSQGIWWYGTQGGGLCRDDGHGMEVFRSDRDHPDLLGSNDVTCLAECRSRHELWFGTKKGAYAITQSDRQLRSLLPDLLVDMRLNCMMEAADGSMWVAYRNTLLVVDAQADTVRHTYELTWQGRNRSVVSMAQDRTGTIWLSLWNGGLCRKVRGATDFEPCPWEREDYCTQLSYDSLRSCILAVTSTGERLMVPRGQTLAVPDIDRSETLRQALIAHAPPRDSILIAYAETPDSICYLGTFHSLYRYIPSLDTLQRIDLETGRVRDLTTSSDGTLYFLSKSLGLCQFTGDSALVLCADANFRTLELRGDSLLWLTDGVGNASTFDLRTRQLTQIDVPQPQSATSSHTWHWWLLLLLIPVIAFSIYYYKRSNVNGQSSMFNGQSSMFNGQSSMVNGQWSPTETPAVAEEEMAEPALSVADREWLEKAVAALAAHISDPDYSVDALASDLCMSRTALYRRMRQVSGQTPTDFLRNQRLDRAAELLRTTDSSVNDVADQVGFAYASYFTRCFKERFGVAPKDFR